MKVSITGKQVDIGAALRLHTEQELTATVTKYFDNPVAAQAVFSRGTGQFQADLHIHLFRRMVLQAQGSGDTAYAALAEALQHAATRLRRYKRRLKTHNENQRAAALATLPASQYVLTPEREEESSAPEPETAEQALIIAEMTTETEIETLSVSEAVMRMDLAHLPAMLFRNPKHGGLNLVYQRQDGNIGWVDPQIPAEQQNPG